MGYLMRLIGKLFEPADDGSAEQRLKNDFGERIRFSSYRKINGNFQPDTFFGTKQAEYPMPGLGRMPLCMCGRTGARPCGSPWIFLHLTAGTGKAIAGIPYI